MRRKSPLILNTFMIITVVFVIFCMPKTALCTDPQEQFSASLAAGEQKINQGKFKEALIEFKKSLKINPNDADANYKAGVASYFLRNYKDASSYYNKSIKTNPKHYKALNNLGMILEKEDKNIEATRMYEKALEAEPKYKKACYNLGRVLYKRSLLNRAEKVAKDLLRLDPSDEEGQFLLALIYEHSANLTAAKELYQKASGLSTLKDECQAGINRVNGRIQQLEPKKVELIKANNIIKFKIPAGFEFSGYKHYPSGLESAQLSFRNNGTINLIKINDNSDPSVHDPKVLLLSKNKNIQKIFSDLEITNITISDNKIMDLNNPEVDSDTGEKTVKYSRIHCDCKGQKSDAIVSVIPPSAGKSPILFIALSQSGKFDPKAAGIFLANVGE